MSSLALPKDLEDWIDGEVAAGRAPSASAFVAQALKDAHALQAFRASCDAADAEGGGEARFPAA